MLDAAEPDDPWSQLTLRNPELVTDDDRRRILASGLDADVVAVRDGRMLTVSRTAGNLLSLSEGPLRVVADAVEIDTTTECPQLVVSGRTLADEHRRRIFLREELPEGSDRDYDGRVSRIDSRWSFTVPISELVPSPERPERSDAGITGEKAHATLMAADQSGESAAVLCSNSAMSRLPVEVQWEDFLVTVQPHSGTLRVSVS